MASPAMTLAAKVLTFFMFSPHSVVALEGICLSKSLVPLKLRATEKKDSLARTTRTMIVLHVLRVVLTGRPSGQA
jgi:hypothetical protein